MKQISITPDDETIEQIRQLAELWGMPEQRHNTAVIQRCVERVWMLELGGKKMEEAEQYRRSIDNDG